MSNKISLTFDDFDFYIKILEKYEKDTKEVAEKALIKSKDYVNDLLRKEMERHNRTHTTVNSIRDTVEPQWVGTRASIDVGFDLKNGGMPSIFLMFGTPKMKKDQKLYNAMFSNKTKQKIKEIQEEVFEEATRGLI